MELPVLKPEDIEKSVDSTEPRRRRSFVSKTHPQSGNLIEFNVKKDILASGLGRVASVVESRNTIPIVGSVKIDAGDDKLTIAGTDLDIYAIETIAAEVLSAPASVAVDAHRLHDIISVLPKKADVRFSLAREENSRLKITSGRATFNLGVYNVADFPSEFGADMTTDFPIESGTLKRLFERIQFAISTEETRYYLNGIFLHPVGANLRAVATDGHRLARIDAEWPYDPQPFAGVILPRKFVQKAINLLSGLDHEDEIRLLLSDRKVTIDNESSVLSSKLIDGSFPDYDRVIPSEHKTRAVLKTEDLKAAATRVLKMATDKNNAIKLTLSVNSLTIACNNREHGDSKEDIDAEVSGQFHVDGKPFETGLNGRYLLDMLPNCGDDIEIKMDGPSGPVVFAAPGESAETANPLFVIMPMRV